MSTRRPQRRSVRGAACWRSWWILSLGAAVARRPLANDRGVAAMSRGPARACEVDTAGLHLVRSTVLEHCGCCRVDVVPVGALRFVAYPLRSRALSPLPQPAGGWDRPQGHLGEIGIAEPPNGVTPISLAGGLVVVGRQRREAGCGDWGSVSGSGSLRSASRCRTVARMTAPRKRSLQLWIRPLPAG